MAIRTLRRNLAILVCISLLVLGSAAIYRLSNFIQIFRPHAGIALDQPSIASAHSIGASDSRPQLIPKIIHQIFHDWTDPDNDVLPSDWESMRQTCIGRNPEYKYRVSRMNLVAQMMTNVRQLWSTRDSRDFIQRQFPWFLNTYDDYVMPIQRVDAMRYFLMRHFGGIYIDLDNVSRSRVALLIMLQGCETSLDPLLYYPVWVTDGGHGALSNNILGAEPNHPFWILLTDMLIPYAWNYPLPYVTVSYASGQWFETVAWEHYHQTKHRNAPPLTRVMMDGRPGAARHTFFTQGRGLTWHRWDNALFDWIGSHLVWTALFIAVCGSGLIFLFALLLRAMSAFQLSLGIGLDLRAACQEINQRRTTALPSGTSCRSFLYTGQVRLSIHQTANLQ